MHNLGILDSQNLFPQRSIKILVVDDEFALVDLYLEHLKLYELYDVTCAYNATTADKILSSPKRFHVCIMDLGLCDINNDEYYLMEKYYPRISFIVATARNTLEKGYHVKECGAAAAINKPVNFYKLEVFNQINKAFIHSLVCPEHIEECKPVIKLAVKTFIHSKPDSIIEWTEAMRIEKRYFRKAWHDTFGYQPKHIIWLNRMYSSAFSYYNSLYNDKFILRTKTPDTRYNEAINFNKRFSPYCKKNFKEINRILSK